LKKNWTAISRPPASWCCIQDDAAFAGARRQMLLQRELGSTQEAVSADRCVEIEPALKSRHGQIAGAIYTPANAPPTARKPATA
jgi:D-amino-acid dehydrogenase